MLVVTMEQTVSQQVSYFNKYFPKDKFFQIKLVSTYRMFILTAGNLMIFGNKWSYNLSYQAWELRAAARNALKHEKLNFMGGNRGCTDVRIRQLQ